MQIDVLQAWQILTKDIENVEEENFFENSKLTPFWHTMKFW